ncbi:MAG TPA: hypothetical protein PL119_03200, partial [Bacteroidales bacterium]|nr:hypothetical protein [Bacteroidales bacterium]
MELNPAVYVFLIFRKSKISRMDRYTPVSPKIAPISAPPIRGTEKYMTISSRYSSSPVCAAACTGNSNKVTVARNRTKYPTKGLYSERKEGYSIKKYIANFTKVMKFT